VKRRFVVQRHEVAPGDVHFDFMVEAGEKLATWKFPGPLPEQGELVGERSFDHRRVYLEFEGEISGGRGRVSIVARGELEDREGDPSFERYSFTMGSRACVLEAMGGRVRLSCISTRSAGACE
jgi:hypothetical protein